MVLEGVTDVVRGGVLWATLVLLKACTLCRAVSFVCSSDSVIRVLAFLLSCTSRLRVGLRLS